MLMLQVVLLMSDAPLPPLGDASIIAEKQAMMLDEAKAANGCSQCRGALRTAAWRVKLFEQQFHIP